MPCSHRFVSRLSCVSALLLTCALADSMPARAQNANFPDATSQPSVSQSSARAAAIAARISLGILKPARNSSASQADLQALRDQNTRLKIALARAEAEGGSAPVAAPAVVKPVAEAAIAPVYTERKIADPDAVVAAENFTGLLIDARDLSSMQRSPSPVIYGPVPYNESLYPDPKHVPSPDEVQDESVVRYYTSLPDAFKGFVGDHPLILKAVTALGPGTDCPSISADDMALLKALDRRIHFSQTWKVGILLPEGK